MDLRLFILVIILLINGCTMGVYKEGNKMHSHALDFNKYDTDKMDNGYMKRYDKIFSNYIDKKINLLELGVFHGGSLLMWRDYFSQGNIFGIDLNAPQQLNNEKRIRVFSGAQQDLNFLSNVGKNVPDGFDIIIDDASHIGRFTKDSFWYLFDNHLKSGGIYVIEDWGTGYWSDWEDGQVFNENIFVDCYKSLKSNGKLKGDYFPNHSFGMVGFIKQLIDEQGFEDLTRQNLNGNAERDSKFDSITIAGGMVIIYKKL